MRAILPPATAILKEDKTDFTHVYLARTGEVNSCGITLKGNEAWRKSIALGSALCSKTDIRRINLGCAAFNNYTKAWSYNIPLQRLLLYSALVVSVLMYNSSCCADPQIFLERLDVVHRRKLPHTMNIKYPGVITKIISSKVPRSRWKMFGHVLRGPIDGPAFSSLVFAINILQ